MMFSDCDFSTLSPENAFTVIPLLLMSPHNMTLYHMRIQLLSNHHVCSTKCVSIDGSSFFAANAKRKETSASKERKNKQKMRKKCPCHFTSFKVSSLVSKFKFLTNTVVPSAFPESSSSFFPLLTEFSSLCLQEHVQSQY